jgi:hypothetical protein
MPDLINNLPGSWRMIRTDESLNFCGRIDHRKSGQVMRDFRILGQTMIHSLSGVGGCGSETKRAFSGLVMRQADTLFLK